MAGVFCVVSLPARSLLAGLVALLRSHQGAASHDTDVKGKKRPSPVLREEAGSRVQPLPQPWALGRLFHCQGPACSSASSENKGKNGISRPSWMTHACVLLLALLTGCRVVFFQEPVCGLFWKIVFHRLHPEHGTPASLQISELEEAHPVFLGAEPS